MDAESTQPAVVLVVDDDSHVREVITIALAEELGAFVAIARDGHEALERARRLRPDLILLDLVLPGLDGYTVAERLRADPATRSVPIIAVSGWAEVPENRMRALDAGCSAILSKPFDVGHLLDRVREWLRKERPA